MSTSGSFVLQRPGRLVMRIANFLVLGALVAGIFAVTPAYGDVKFNRWVSNFWPVARKAGISKRIYDQAFAKITPDRNVIKLANRQPERILGVGEYIATRVTASRISTGRKLEARYANTLIDISRRYGVSKYIILAIWGMETNYGQIFKNQPKILRSVIRVLASLAYYGKKVGRYAKYGRKQLIPALKILQRGDVGVKGLVGSWAGAMGHTQFIPSSYLGYAVDYDGDGRADIWNSIPDALASSANYLKKFGWQRGKTWGYEVQLPRRFKKSLASSKIKKSLAAWRRLGIKRTGKGDFPRPGDLAYLYLPGGVNGPAFLMLKNFSVIKRYNSSNSYALAVGHLADRILGGASFVGRWPK